MTISIKTEIVGAEIGDRVAWDNAYSGRCFGRIEGIDGGRIAVSPEGPAMYTRYLLPSALELAPKRYAIGDKVGLADLDALPDGTLLNAVGSFLPVAKVAGGWVVIRSGGVTSIEIPAGRRTIAYLPKSYTEGEA